MPPCEYPTKWTSLPVTSFTVSMAWLSATMWSARLRRIPPSTLSGEPKSMTQGSSPAACRIPTAPSCRVTSHMSADIIIGCTISTGGPTGVCPGRLSGGKYRRSLYIGTLSTIWDGDGTLPVSRPPSRRTSRPFCAVATRRSTGRVTIEKFRSTRCSLTLDSVDIMAHRHPARVWSGCLPGGMAPRREGWWVEISWCVRDVLRTNCNRPTDLTVPTIMRARR